MNSINDEESLNNVLSLTDILHDMIIVIVDDAASYDTQTIVNEFAKDHEDEAFVTESFLNSRRDTLNHIIISEQDVKMLLKKVSKCRYFDIKESHPKNAEFIEQHDLSNSDIIKIVKQLDSQDYCYTLKSKNKFHLGALLHVFISNKEFDLGTRKINNISIYVKIEYTSEGFVCVVSIHAPDYQEAHPYSDSDNKTLEEN